MTELNHIPANNLWNLDDGRVIYLVTIPQFHAMVDGTKLICIDGREVTKGKDYIDEDTRAGWMAFGVLPE